MDTIRAASKLLYIIPKRSIDHFVGAISYPSGMILTIFVIIQIMPHIGQANERGGKLERTLEIVGSNLQHKVDTIIKNHFLNGSKIFITSFFF